MSACVCTQSCLTVCHPMDCSPPGCSVCGIFKARILERVAISSSKGSSRPRDQTQVSCIPCIGRLDSLPLESLGKPTLCLYRLEETVSSSQAPKLEGRRKRASPFFPCSGVVLMLLTPPSQLKHHLHFWHLAPVLGGSFWKFSKQKPRLSGNCGRDLNHGQCYQSERGTSPDSKPTRNLTFFFPLKTFSNPSLVREWKAVN